MATKHYDILLYLRARDNDNVAWFIFIVVEKSTSKGIIQKPPYEPAHHSNRIETTNECVQF